MRKANCDKRNRLEAYETGSRGSSKRKKFSFDRYVGGRLQSKDEATEMRLRLKPKL